MAAPALQTANAKTPVSGADARPCAWSCTLELRTPGPMSFVDLTDRIHECVDRSRVADGLVNLQCLHTSAALLVNEHEPLLHEDFRSLLERWAPRGASGRALVRPHPGWFPALRRRLCRR